MALQFSIAARNGRLDAFEIELGADPVLRLRSGAQPANCAAGDSGTVLCSMTLPADAFAVASNGSKDKNGTWQGAAVGGGGTIGHFRLYKSNGTTCVLQGSVGLGSGDLQLDNNVVADGQVITVTGFTLTDGNA